MKQNEMFTKAHKLGYGIHFLGFQDPMLELRKTSTNEKLHQGGFSSLRKIVNRYWALRAFS